MVVPDSDLKRIISELPLHEKLTREKTGCISFEVSQDQYNRNHFTVYEKFTNQATFDYHQLRVEYSTWRDVKKNVQRHYHVILE